MSRWRFVGRTDELNRLIEAASGATGRGLFFSGTAGIGKSRLLREGIGALPTEGYAVWAASANIATAGLPFGGLAQVLPADQPRGLSPAGILRWAVDALQQQAAGRPIVLAVDDAHLLDPSSAALVYLIARLQNATVLGTLRNGEQLPVSIRALWTDDLIDHAELTPLNAQETARLLAAILKGPVDTTSAERLWRLSAGNPLLIRELIMAASASGELIETYGMWRWTGRLGLAPSLTDLIDTRIGALSPGVRAVVELVAFGEPVGLDLLIRATNPADVEAAEERGLISVVLNDRRQNVRLAHPLYGEVVRRRCPVSRTRRLKAQLADLVERAGKRRPDDLLRVAVWRLDSGTAQDPALLLNAASQAFQRYEVPLATRLARASLDAGGGFDAAELLATMLFFADQPDEATEVLNRVADQISSSHRRSRWLTVHGLVSYWGLGRESTVEEIATAAKTLNDPADLALTRAFEAIMRLHRLETDRALQLSRAVLDRPAASVVARQLARCTIAHLQAARGELVRSQQTITAVEADAARWRSDMPYLQLALELARGTRLTLAGDLTGLDAIVAAEFADLADAGDFRLGSGYLSILRAYAARLRGRSGEALRSSLNACAVLATSRVYVGLAHAERAQAAALRGDVKQAKEAMAESDRRHAPGMGVLYPWREQARAAVLAAGGDLAGAIRHLSELALRLREDGLAGHELLALHDLVRYGAANLLLHPAATTVAHVGSSGAGEQTGVSTRAQESSTERGSTVVQRLIELTERVDGPLPPLLARHAQAATGGPADDTGTRGGNGEQLLAVADRFAELGLYLFAVEAAAGAVAALRQTHPSAVSGAQGRLGDLLAYCDVIRTPALAKAVGNPTLTNRERQIARLAAEGTPSRSIAERLFLSPRTVENHLQRVYSKLGVAGRGELRGALRALPDRDGDFSV